VYIDWGDDIYAIQSFRQVAGQVAGRTFPNGIYYQTFVGGYVSPLFTTSPSLYLCFIFSHLVSNLYLSSFLPLLFYRPEGGYVSRVDGTLYEVERSWGVPFSMKPLRGKKLVFRMPDDDHCDPRLKVVDVDEPDEDDLSEHIPQRVRDDIGNHPFSCVFVIPLLFYS
jgi:hypothetical protein